MGDGKVNVGEAQTASEFSDCAAKMSRRPSVRSDANFNFGPRNAAGRRAQGFDDGFLRGPPAGKTFHAALVGVTDANLAIRVDAVQKLFAVSLDQASDPQAFDNVRTDADDFHGSLLPRAT
jgi:hypothetical protein